MSDETPRATELLLIQGPLALNWRRRKWGLLPRLENAELSSANPLREERVELWVRQHIHVLGRPEWVFVKLHTHGCRDDNADVMLSSATQSFYRALMARFGNGTEWCCHCTSARALCNIVLAAESGLSDEPGHYLTHRIAAPA